MSFVKGSDRFRERAEHAWGPITEEFLASGGRFTRDELDGSVNL